MPSWPPPHGPVHIATHCTPALPTASWGSEEAATRQRGGRLVPQTGPRVCHTWGTRTQSEVPHCVEARGARMEGGPGDPDVITVRLWSRMEHTTIGGLRYPGRGPVRPASGRRPERATSSWRRPRRPCPIRRTRCGRRRLPCTGSAGRSGPAAPVGRAGHGRRGALERGGHATTLRSRIIARWPACDLVLHALTSAMPAPLIGPMDPAELPGGWTIRSANSRGHHPRSRHSARWGRSVPMTESLPWPG